MAWENPAEWPALDVNVLSGGGSDMSTVGGVAVSLGQKTSAASLPMVLASDQSLAVNGNVTASGSFQPIPGTTGGLTMYKAIVPNNVTGVVVKNSPGMIYGIELFNNSAVIAWLHLYNVTSAPTAGAGTIVKTLLFPAPAAGGGGGIIYMPWMGLTFDTGIAYTVTTGIADNDVAIPAAATYAVNIDYK